jgi:hypothetical protein
MLLLRVAPNRVAARVAGRPLVVPTPPPSARALEPEPGRARLPEQERGAATARGGVTRARNWTRSATDRQVSIGGKGNIWPAHLKGLLLATNRACPLQVIEPESDQARRPKSAEVANGERAKVNVTKYQERA